MHEDGPEDVWAMHGNASMHDHGASDEIAHAGEPRRSRDAGERVVQGLAKGRGPRVAGHPHATDHPLVPESEPAYDCVVLSSHQMVREGQAGGDVTP